MSEPIKHLVYELTGDEAANVLKALPKEMLDDAVKQIKSDINNINIPLFVKVSVVGETIQ